MSNATHSRRVTATWKKLAIAALTAIACSPFRRADDAKAIVAALDTQYQAAVKANDAATMDRILADDFVLVTGRGQAFTKADLLKDARDKTTIYEHQEEEAGTQTVRVWGDTAVVTALLWIKGTRAGDRDRLQAVVQRHLRSHAGRLALRLRPGVDRVAEDHRAHLSIRPHVGRDAGSKSVRVSAAGAVGLAGFTGTARR